MKNSTLYPFVDINHSTRQRRLLKNWKLLYTINNNVKNNQVILVVHSKYEQTINKVFVDSRADDLLKRSFQLDLLDSTRLCVCVCT